MMDEEIETLLVSVRADTRAFASDVQAMKRELDGPLADGLERAGRALESTLSKAIRTGKLELDDLRKAALSILSDIAQSAIASGLNSLGLSGGGGGGSSGLMSSLAQAVASLFGAPGRATGGPVSPGQLYRVGERGPEWFVPTSAGRIETGAVGASGAEIRLTVNVSDHGRGSAPQQIERSARHVARAVRSALER